jgi:hypothetical protein
MMGAVKVIKLICDCDDVINKEYTCHREVEGYSVTEAREKAKEAGWTFLYKTINKKRKGLDLCPIHSNMYAHVLEEQESPLRQIPDPTPEELTDQDDQDEIDQKKQKAYQETDISAQTKTRGSANKVVNKALKKSKKAPQASATVSVF